MLFVSILPAPLYQTRHVVFDENVSLNLIVYVFELKIIQSVSCEKKFAHAHVRAHTHVCDVRAKSMFERACDVRACGLFNGCAMCDRTSAHFRTFFVNYLKASFSFS